jgi:hypothetical protein
MPHPRPIWLNPLLRFDVKALELQAMPPHVGEFWPTLSL